MINRTRLRIVVAAAIFLAALLGAATPAFAAATSSTRISPDSVLRLSPLVLAFLIGSVVPLVTAVATRLDASSRVKAVLNLVLCIAGGVIAAFQANPDGITVLELVSTVIATYLASGVTYAHLWKPTGATPALAEATSHVGVG